MKLFYACIAALAYTFPAFAEQPCAPREAVIGVITGPQYQESLVATMTGPTGYYETYGNERTGTWSIVGTDLNGISCIRAFGDGGFSGSCDTWRTDLILTCAKQLFVDDKRV